MTLQQVDDCDLSPTCLCWISLFHFIYLSMKSVICTNFLPDQFIISLILPGSEVDSRLRTSWRVSMLNSPICPSVKDATRWAGSLHTRSTEEGTPSSCTQKRRHIHVSRSTIFQEKKPKQIMTQALSGYFCLRWALPVRARWCWRPTVSRSRRRSRRGGAGVRCCTLSPTPSRCVRTTLLAASMGLHEAEQVSSHDLTRTVTTFRQKKGGTLFYRRSRTGRCWDWGCSSTVWFRLHLHWNTAPPCCSSPRSARPPCGSD